MNNVDQEYFRLLKIILEKGRVKHNRTGIDTIGVFGEQAKFQVDTNAFPILTTKKVWSKGIIHELLWFIKGDTNIKYLLDNGVHIWDEWAYARYKKAQAWDLNDAEYSEINCEPAIRLYSQDEFIAKIELSPDFASKWGNLGEGTYGSMWRAFPYFMDGEVSHGPIYSDGFGNTSRGKITLKGTVDQLKKVMDKLKTNPDDRRMIVSAWHPHWVDNCALPPCHCLFHFNTEELTFGERLELYYKAQVDGGCVSPSEKDMEDANIPKRRLNLLLYQRSCDFFLGVPFNITSYSLLLAMVAHCVNMVPGVFVHTYGDLHVYSNHLNQVKEQMTREPMKLPKLWLNPAKKDLFSFVYNDIKLVDYQSHPAIKGEVAV